MRPAAIAVSLVGLALLVPPARLGAQAAAASLEELFQEGVKLYDAQDYDGAIARFGELRRYRVEHPAVEYNLGNAHFKKREYGRAVLHWERALRLDPADQETRGNLELVRGLLVDEVEAPPAPLRDFLARASRRLSLDETTIAVIGAWQLLGLATLATILGGGGARRAASGLLVVSLLVLAALAPLLWLQLKAYQGRDRLVVLAAAVEARSGPGEQYTGVFSVHEGLVVRSKGSASGWEWVVLPDGQNGWIRGDDLERI